MSIKSKDVSIQVIRVISMFSIIICHLVQEVNNPLLAKTSQLFNVGVYIFLFVSGWLYGGKKVDDFKKWYKQRVKKVLIPVWIFVFVIFLIHICQGTMKWIYVPIYLTNTQFWFGGLKGVEHLWFISVIFLCYLITPMLYKVNTNIKFILSILVMAIGGYGLCHLNRSLGLTVLYLSVYLCGYSFRRFQIILIHSCLLIIIALFIRVISMILLDGTILYDCFLVYLTHTMLAIGLFYLAKRLIVQQSNRIIDWLDGMSFYIYITHYMFMVGPVRMMGVTENLGINILITLTLSCLSAIILKNVYDLIAR